MVVTIDNIQTRHFERGCCHASYGRRSAPTQENYIYRLCYLFFAQVGVKTGTGNFLARKRHKNAEKYVVNLWTRGGVLDRILTIYNINNPCVTADVSFSAKDKPVVLEFIEPIFLYDYFIHSSKI